MAKYQEIEDTRKELYERYQKERLLAFAFIGVAVLMFLVGYLLAATNCAIVLVVIGFIFGLLAALKFGNVNKIANQFKRYIKSELVDKVLGSYFQDYKYYEHEHIAINNINKAGLVRKPDRYSGEDLITGSYKNVGFKVSDIDLKERQVVRTQHGTTVTYVSYFKGRWYVYKFPKKFDHVLKIIEGRTVADLRGLNKYETEMVEFNKKFNIYSSDQQFFYYMITPYMIERLLLLEQAHRGKIAYAIIDDELHIGINDNSDSLELSFKREINESSILHFEEDVKLIKDIIDELYLDDIKFR